MHAILNKVNNDKKFNKNSILYKNLNLLNKVSKYNVIRITE